MAPRLRTPCTLCTPCTPRGTFVRGQACQPALSLTYHGAEKGMATMDLLGCCISLAAFLFCGDLPDSLWEGNSMLYIGGICFWLLTALKLGLVQIGFNCVS